MYYYLFTVQYDGTDFCGWAKQKEQPTIQGAIESAISRVARGSSYRLVGASKTDAGVHALDQKVWVELDFQPNTPGFLQALNNALPRAIVITKIVSITPEFRVRNCRLKTYQYVINLQATNVLTNRFYYQSKQDFNIKKFKTALQLFVGEHDFFHFSGLKEHELTSIKTIRKINKIKVFKQHGCLKIIFKAKGFIRYQIRMMVGTALAYGANKVSLDTIRAVLLKKQPKLPYLANPEGLTLLAIDY